MSNAIVLYSVLASALSFSLNPRLERSLAYFNSSKTYKNIKHKRGKKRR